MKVLTYNIHQWEGRDGRLDVARLANIIADSGASIVSLNEVLHPVYTVPKQREPLRELAEQLGMRWTFGPSCRTARRPGWWGPVGNAVLSRFPIVASSSRPLPRLPLTQERNLVVARLRLGSGRYFTVYATHLDHAFEGTRLWQLRGVVEKLRHNGRDPHLLMGDFNTHTPTGPRGQRFAPPVVRWLRSEGYLDAFSLVGKGPAETFRYILSRWRIDYIFVPVQLSHRLVSCRTLQGGLIEQASDHRPVLAELDLD